MATLKSRLKPLINDASLVPTPLSDLVDIPAKYVQMAISRMTRDDSSKRIRSIVANGIVYIWKEL